MELKQAFRDMEAILEALHSTAYDAGRAQGRADREKDIASARDQAWETGYAEGCEQGQAEPKAEQ